MKAKCRGILFATKSSKGYRQMFRYTMTIIFILSSSAGMLRADEFCNEKRTELDVPSTLADYVREIGRKALDRRGRLFDNSSQGDESDLDLRGCFVLDPFSTAALEGKIPTSYDGQSETPLRLVKTYFSLRNRHLDDLEGLHEILGQSPEAIEEALKSAVSESDLKIVKAFHDTFEHGNKAKTPDEFEALFLSELRNVNARQNLNTNEKLALIQMYGHVFLRNYDKRRNDRGISERGKTVTTGELLTVAHAETPQQAGVCRDIASAQGKIAEALGFENVFVVDFQQDNGIYHATLAASDPDDRKKIHKIDYDVLRTTRDGEGASVLDQGESDHTLVYRLSKPFGRTVGNIPSEQMYFLTDAVGSDTRLIDEMARPRHSVIGLNTKDDSGYAQARIVAGSDSTSAYAAIAADGRYHQDSHFPGHIGASLGYRQKMASSRGGIGYLYLHLDQGAGIKVIDKEDLELRFDTRAIVNTLVSVNEDGEVGPQADVDLSAGARLEHTHMNGDLTFAHEIRGHIKPGFSDISKMSLAPVMDRVSGHSDVRYQLAKREEDGHNAALLLDVTAVGNQFGWRGRAEAGAAVDNVAASAFIQGRLTEDMPPYFSGSERRVGGQLVADLEPVIFRLEGSKSLESDDCEGSCGVELKLGKERK